MEDELIVLLTKDLMFASRAKSMSRDQNVSLKNTGSLAATVNLLETERVGLLLIDLETRIESLAELLKAARSGDDTHATTTIAYAPHGQVGRLREARAAGFDQVLTRGQFHEQLEALLARRNAIEPDQDEVRDP